MEKLTLEIPVEIQDSIRALSKAEDLADFALQMNVHAFGKAIESGDAEAAYVLRRKKEPELMEAKKKAHDVLWDAIKEALPQTAVGNWSLEHYTMILTEKKSMKESLFSSLMESMSS